MDESETLVLIPGLNCTEELFRQQVDALGSTRRILVADVRRDASIEGMAGRLLGAAPERFALAGLSMGGYVAIEALRQAPARVTHLALLDTTARSDAPEARQRREQLIALAESKRFEEVHPVLWELLVRPGRRSDAALEAVVRRMMAETGPEAFARQERALMARPDARPVLPGIEIPTLVLVGAEDAITPPDLAREMAEAIEWASLVVVPDCGHLSTLERPEAVTEAMRAWLALGRAGV